MLVVQSYVADLLDAVAGVTTSEVAGTMHFKLRGVFHKPLKLHLLNTDLLPSSLVFLHLETHKSLTNLLAVSCVVQNGSAVITLEPACNILMSQTVSHKLHFFIPQYPRY